MLPPSPASRVVVPIFRRRVSEGQGAEGELEPLTPLDRDRNHAR